MIPIPTGNRVLKLLVTAVVIGANISAVIVVINLTSLQLIKPIHKLTEKPIKPNNNKG